MPKLSERLKALGVNLGAHELTQKNAERKRNPISEALAGTEIDTKFGFTYLIEERHNIKDYYGISEIRFSIPNELLENYCEISDISKFNAQDYVYIDIETTGLGLGTGTFAFLIGFGKYSGEHFSVNQFFLRDPGEETAALAALSEEISESPIIVSFNGKSFDLPILNNRFILNGLTNPLINAPHLDLLHLSRRLWKERLPSRTLINLEGQILSAQRSQEDVPGWVIPQLYKDYLYTGDATLIKSVVYHNAKDILAMVGLLNYINTLLDSPIENNHQHITDLISIGILHETLGRLEDATEIYNHALSLDLPLDNYLSVINRLSFIYKRKENFESAVKLWQQAGEYQQIYACVELAKYYEHKNKDFQSAIHWVMQGLSYISDTADSIQWKYDLEYRLNRLTRKLLSKKERPYDNN